MEPLGIVVVGSILGIGVCCTDNTLGIVFVFENGTIELLYQYSALCCCCGVAWVPNGVWPALPKGHGKLAARFCNCRAILFVVAILGNSHCLVSKHEPALPEGSRQLVV